ncbi:THAP domain-containing protein 7 [Pongo pygmaeus]
MSVRLSPPSRASTPTSLWTGVRLDLSQRSSRGELPPLRLSRLPEHCRFPLPGRPVHWGRSIVPGCLRRKVRPERTKEKPTWATILVVRGAGTTRTRQRLAHWRRLLPQLARNSPRPARVAGHLRLSSLYGTNFRRALPLARLRRRSNGQTMPRHCSAAGCCTRDTRETRNRGISFHRLPKKDNPRRGLWLANCQRLDPSGQGLWDPASEYIYFCSKHFEENCFELVGISGYHRLKEGAVPTIFESFSKLRRTTKTKGHSYSPGPPEVSRLRRCRKRCSEGRGPTTPFSPPPPADVTCFPVEEASAPATLPASPAGRLEPGLSSPFSDLLGPLGAQADEAGCSAQPSPERQPSPLEPRPVSPSAYMLRLPPPAGAYIQNEHSYQVGSALLWKRRAEAALDALDKAQRQLQACKRREQRLRLRLTKLQQERAREKRAQADARQTLKEHVQDFAMQLSSSMA